MDYIARIHSDFPTKFGIPRQSGLTGALLSKIVFEPAYRNPDFLRGIDSWSHRSQIRASTQGTAISFIAELKRDAHKKPLPNKAAAIIV